MMNQLKGYYESNRTGEHLGFPVTVLAMNVMYNSLHWHNHGEIICCCKGQVRVRVEGTERVLNPGDVTFINGEESHEIYNGRENELQIIAFVDPDIMGNMENRTLCLDNINETGLTLIREALSQMAYLSLPEPADHYKMFEGVTLSDENKCKYLMYMYQLLMVLMKYKIESIHPNKKKNDIIKKCADYINEHLGDELNAAVLAEQFHVSKPTIYRLFSEKIGLPLGQYITSVRINAACRCLEETDDKISNIAMNCGFTGLSNFYRIFSLQVGVSPKEYRKDHQIPHRSHTVYQPEIMNLNRFQHFAELGMQPDELLLKASYNLD